MNYCVVKYEPFKEEYIILARCVRKDDAKNFAKMLSRSIDEQIVHGINIRKDVEGFEHGGFMCYPEYHFACLERDIEEYIEIFFDDVVEVIAVKY